MDYNSIANTIVQKWWSRVGRYIPDEVNHKNAVALRMCLVMVDEVIQSIQLPIQVDNNGLQEILDEFDRSNVQLKLYNTVKEIILHELQSEIQNNKTNYKIQWTNEY